MKKYAIICTLIMLCFGSVPLTIHAKEVDDVEVVNNNIQIRSSSDNIIEYEITESGDTFTLVTDTKNDIVIVNDNVYTYNDIVKALSEQGNENKNQTSLSLVHYLNQYEPISKVNTEQYVLEHSQVDMKMLSDSACLVYGACNPNAVPTSGYGAMKLRTTMPDKQIVLSLASGAIAVFASWYTGGSLPLAKRAISTALTGLGISLSASVSSHVKCDIYQAYHTSCPATKQQRKYYYTLVGNSAKQYVDVETTYFYHSNPY